MKKLRSLLSPLLILPLLVTMLLPLATRKAEATNVGPNLIANASFETSTAGQPTAWQQAGWGTNTTSFSYDNSGHTGSYSGSINMTKYSDGDAKWMFNPIAVTAGSRYTYSDFFQATGANQVVVQFDDGASNYSYLWLASPSTNTAWTAFSSSFTVPAKVKNATVFHLIDSVGTLKLDGASLNAILPDAPASDGNILANPSVETAGLSNTTVPDQWNQGAWGTNTTSFSYLNTGHTGSHSVKVQTTSYTSGATEWFPNAQPVVGGQLYAFSDYYQSSINTEVEIGVTMQDGSTQYLTVGKPYASTTWNSYFGEITMPVGAVSATVYHLMYGVGYLTIDDMDFRPYTPVGFNQGIVSLTFDDGYTSAYTNGLAALSKYGYKGTYYIISGSVGDTVDGYMTSANVKTLYKDGEEIGSHTVTHPDLTTLTPAQLTTELSQSQTALQKLTGTPVTDFAYPYGTYNAATLTAAKKYYSLQRSTDAGFNSKDEYNPQNIIVQNILDTTPTAQVQAWVDYAIQTKTWLVLVYHQVDTDPAAGDYNTYPADLNTELSYMKSKNVKVETIKQAAADVAAQH